MVKMEHALEKRPGFTGSWDENNDDWELVKNKYQKTHCATPGCQTCYRTFCSCNKKVTMCQGCYSDHYAFICGMKQDPPK